jgi:3-hydroxyisobutyrate dehydrogenase-like beta-hydroxyacid dehydrogenase
VTLCYTQTVTLIEALLLGVKGGIEPSKMLDLIQNSAGTSYCATAYGPEIVAGTYDASFPISHAAKDMRLAMDLARTVDADLPFMADVAELYQRTEAEYGPTAAHLLAAQMIERSNELILHEKETMHD